jgi:hypothetical protein
MKFFFALCCFLTTAMLFPGLAAGEWFTDFEKAKAESLKTKRPIYILFTNSDAAACINFERTIFSQRKFQDYADSNLILMKADFPVALHLQPKGLQQQNRELRTKFGVSVLPTALLLNADGELYIDFVKADGNMERHRRKLNEIMDFDPPKRYAEYIHAFVKKYTPPEPVEKKKPEEKKPARKPARKPAQKPAASRTQPAVAAETNIPDENAGNPLIPLDPEGNFQDWLKSRLAEEAVEEAKEAETAKEIVEEEKEAIEEAEAAKEEAVEEAEAPKETEKEASAVPADK